MVARHTAILIEFKRELSKLFSCIRPCIRLAGVLFRTELALRRELTLRPVYPPIILLPSHPSGFSFPYLYEVL